MKIRNPWFRLCCSLAMDAGFEETKHPRKDDGKFSSGSGGSGAHGGEAASKAATPSPQVFRKNDATPPSLNGRPLKSWRPPADWNGVSGQDHSIKEPPFPKASGKKRATGLIMREPDGRVWLAKPTNEFGGYKYTFPKGKLEPDLHPQANAIKEAYEETGLKGRITGYAGDAEGDTSITRYYYADRESGTPQDHGWESEGVALVHPQHLHQFLNRSRDQQLAQKHLGAPMPKS